MSKGRILVVDDEYGIRSGVRQILELEGYAVEEAETGRAALAVLDQGAFDCILIDYRLPDIDGLTLLQAIRSRETGVMTCMITAYANIETAVAATRQGVDFFLPKPFSPDDLLGVIETLLLRKKQNEAAAQLKLAHEAGLSALASEKSQTRSLVESLRDAVLVVNRAGEVVLVNRAMVFLLQSEEALLLRQPVDAVLCSDDFAPVRSALGVSSTSRTVFDMELGDRQYMVSIAPFHSETREVLGHILTISDISEMRRLAMEKSRFIRTMVHEFRSPLGAIKGILEVALDKSLGDRLEAYLPLLSRAEIRLDAMVELIGNLLSVSRIEMEGQNRAPAKPIDVNPVVKEIRELYRERAATRHLGYEITVEPDLGGVLIAAEDLRTILTNLVGNAIKYNRDQGTVALRIGRDNGEVRIEVADTGLGIRAQNLPHLFTEFFREKRPETRGVEGNGLGLAIVKRLVERAAGRINVASTEGAGTTFTLYLPAGPPPDPQQANP
ncbi:MAG: response regulator [Deltaproteobacteria bacterium]|nr:response regulator [Deltaproteobacteria bacterium]